MANWTMAEEDVQKELNDEMAAVGEEVYKATPILRGSAQDLQVAYIPATIYDVVPAHLKPGPNGASHFHLFCTVPAALCFSNITVKSPDSLALHTDDALIDPLQLEAAPAMETSTAPAPAPSTPARQNNMTRQQTPRRQAATATNLTAMMNTRGKLTCCFVFLLVLCVVLLLVPVSFCLCIRCAGKTRAHYHSPCRAVSTSKHEPGRQCSERFCICGRD